MNSLVPTLLALALCGAAPVEVELSLSGGRTLRGALVEFTERQVTIAGAEGNVTQPTSQLLALAPTTAPSAQPDQAPFVVTLVDGTVLPAAGYTVAKGKALIQLPGREDKIELPTTAIAHVALHPIVRGDMQGQWNEIVGDKHDSDLLVIGKRETLDFLEGELGDIDDTTVQFTLDGEVVPVKRTKAAGIAYFHPEAELPGAVGVASTNDGLHVALHHLRVDGDTLHAKTPAGVEIGLPLATLTRIDFSQGKIMYLGELKPESVEWTPYLGAAALVPAAAAYYQPRIDAAFEGGPLRLDGQEFARGLALRSKTAVVYRLPGKFGRFTAVAGIDDGVRPQGNVKLEIHGDDRVLLQAAIDGRGPALPIDLDLTGVSRLKIVVDFGEDLDVGDQLDLGDARIAK